ncbi:MAG: preprotein translocase subunit SecG [Chitinophagaceae bacterium]|nr:MAG: preprotein translocase subunit SecG [Chitinophagaceae bacterium]
MYILLTILILIICVILILIVLIQNPKGGGLSASFGGFGNQVLGARQTTDFLEKATWTLAIVLLVFSLSSGFFIPDRGQTIDRSELEGRTLQTPIPMENQNIPPTEFGGDE